MSYWRPHFYLSDDMLKVAYGNNTSFAEYQLTFWLALPSWFRKLSSVFAGNDVLKRSNGYSNQTGKSKLSVSNSPHLLG